MAKQRTRAQAHTPNTDAAAVWAPIDSIHPWENNPRNNDGEPIKRVADSLTRFGWGSPIVARPNGEIIAGHTRWKAAKLLGQKTVPVRYLNISESDAHQLALADNKLGELAVLDDKTLFDMLDELPTTDTKTLGWDPNELIALQESIASLDEINKPPDTSTQPPRLDKKNKSAQCPECGHEW